jgi:hypothetical protein
LDLVIDLAKIIQAIKQAEAKKRVYEKLKRIKGKILSSGLDHIIIQDANGSQETIFDPDIMYKRLIDRNIKHFSQADGTPFTVEPLKSLLGPYGTSEFAADLLAGNIDIDTLDVNEATRTILEQLQRRPYHGKISCEILTDEVIEGYMKWGEFTSTSPSGAHLGHDKAMLQRMKTQDKEAFLAGKSPIYKRYFEIKTILMNSAIKLGHVYNRWKKVVNALIEKIPGLPLLDKLRVIHLIESDFNLMIGILWGRRLIWEAEDKELFHDGQGGSRPGRRAQEQVLQKHSTYSILRMSQLNGASFDNDAKSCFDRIVMILASLCSQQIGMPAEACELFIKTLNSMRYHVKTAQGISPGFYSSTDNYTIHGPGQGGRGSPAVWVAISSVLMKCMEEYTYGAMLPSPFNGHKNAVFWITGFVDDVTHWCINISRQAETEISEDLQHAAQWWEQLLHASGGKLELSKCFFYILKWKFNSEGIPSLYNTNEFEDQITLVDSETGKEIEIPQRECNMAHKSLGVMESPDGSNKDEFNRLKTLSNTHGRKVVLGRLTKEETRTYYSSTYLPSMSYGLVIGTMSEKQCESIQRNTRQIFLSSMGYNKCSPTAVVHGPKNLGGFGIQNLYDRQATEKILFAIQLLRVDRPASETLRVQLEWAQKISGLNSSIFEDTSTPLPQLSGERWIATLREFLHKSQISWIVPGISRCMLQREHDSYIMEFTRNMKDVEIKRINRCRLYLGAVTVSDITEIDGKSITDWSFNLSEQGRDISEARWPVQTRPGPIHLRTWKNFLRSICVVDSLKLLRPLGRWISPTIRQRKGTTHFIDQSEKSMFFSESGRWFTCDHKRSRKYSTLTHNITETDQPDTSTLLPVLKIPKNNSFVYTWTSHHTTTNLHRTQNNWQNYINALDEWKYHLLINHTLHIELPEICNILINNSSTIMCVSDGSSSSAQDFGTYAWIIYDTINERKIMSGFGHVPGFPVSSYRAEGFGKLAWLTMINSVCYYAKIERQCQIQSFCDNKSIVKRTRCHLKHENLSDTLVPSFDVVREIHIQQFFLNLDTDTKHVKGHLDRKKSFDQLTTSEKLNVEADNIANQANAFFRKKTNKYRQYVLPNGGPFLRIDGKDIWSDEKTYLLWRRSEFILQEYYERSFGISTKTLRTINWSGLKMTRTALTPSILQFSLKIGIDWLPTGKIMHRYGNQTTECILCGGEEDNMHLLFCPNRRSDILNTLQSFNKYLSEISTDPSLSNAITFALHKFFALTETDSFNKCTTPTDKCIIQAINSQDEIGWHRFVRGYIASDWAQIQDQYFLKHNLKQLGDSWSGKIGLWWNKKIHEIWTTRNEQIHKSEHGSHSQAEEEILRKVQDLYEQSNNLPAADKDMLGMPLTQRLAQPIKSLSRWLSLTAPTIKKCILAFSARSNVQQSTLDKFLQSESQTSPNEPTESNNNTTTTEFRPWRDAPDLHHSVQPNTVQKCPELANLDNPMNQNLSRFPFLEQEM